MKYIKWRILLITTVVCLSPILLGVALWDKLPDMVAIHFDMYNNPDNFASKGFAVFGLPVMTVLFQWLCCIANDIKVQKYGENVKIERITKWIIPVMTVVLYVVTLGYAIGWEIDIRRVAVLIVGILLIVTGNYLPKIPYIKNYKLSKEKARKINRFNGFGSVILGIIFIITIFMPPIASVMSLILLMIYVIISVIYAVKVVRE